MGWVCETNPAHEGYPVALVAEDRGGGYVRFRELGYPDAETRPRVYFFQVACECGWRSRRFYAPLTAVYAPHRLELGDETAEAEATEIWREHVKDAERHDHGRRRGGAILMPAQPPRAEDIPGARPPAKARTKK